MNPYTQRQPRKKYKPEAKYSLRTEFDEADWQDVLYLQSLGITMADIHRNAIREAAARERKREKESEERID